MGRTASAVLMGLTIVGCGPRGTENSVSASESASVTGTSGGSTMGSETTYTGEVEYGVAETGWWEDTGGTTDESATGDGTGSTGDESTGTTGSDSSSGTDEGEGGSEDGPVEPLYGVGDSGM
jgi:hypothetical protein